MTKRTRKKKHIRREIYNIGTRLKRSIDNGLKNDAIFKINYATRNRVNKIFARFRHRASRHYFVFEARRFSSARNVSYEVYYIFYESEKMIPLYTTHILGLLFRNKKYIKGYT